MRRVVMQERSLSPVEKLTLWLASLALMVGASASVVQGDRPLPKIVDLLKFNADTPLAQLHQAIISGFTPPGLSLFVR
ncbi:MAG: hypothetical protein IPK79_09980 [Vampirovibrionales bacterium]|nr:hypothetical protein [Vampirovibrionales bacterium]